MHSMVVLDGTLDGTLDGMLDGMLVMMVTMLCQTLTVSRWKAPTLWSFCNPLYLVQTSVLTSSR
jgi:hypothetical protein